MLKTNEESTGVVANLLFGIYDTPVAFAYKILEDAVLEGSLRASYDNDKH